MNFSRRIAPLLLAALLALIIACSGDDDEPTVASTTPPPATATEAATPPIATPPPSSAIPVEPIASDQPYLPVLFDTHGPGPVSSADVPMPAWPLFTAFPFWRTADWRLAVYNSGSRTWQALQLDDHPASPVVSPDGSRAAQTSGGGLLLIDLPALTYRRLGVAGDPAAWSPDGGRLAVRLHNSAPNESPFVIVSTNDPAAAMRLPLGTSPQSLAHFGLTWLDDDSVLVISQQSNLVQIYDVSGSNARIVLEQAIESDQIAVSPDGLRLAVQMNRPDRSTAVALYDLGPFQRIATIEGASLGNQLAVPRGVWNRDASRLLVVRGMCSDEERLVAVSVADGSEAELARAGMMQFVFAPNGVWVAYTAWPRQAYVVMAQPGAQPFFVADEVSAPTTPLWSPDSRYAAFTPFTGGYDRCFV